MPLTVFAGPNSGSSAGAPVFRSLDTGDIPDLSAGKITSGILPVSRGGTGLSASPTSGQILIGNGSGYNVGSLVAGTNITVGNGTGAITISATADANKVTKAGDTMTGTLTLPSDGLLAGGSQLVLAGGNVGIGTSTPNATLDVNGSVTVRGTLSVYSNRITNVATPTASTDAATKAYVDAATAGVQWMGYTAAYNGTLGGGSGGWAKKANTLCNASYSGSHVCSYEEIVEGLTAARQRDEDGTTASHDPVAQRGNAQDPPGNEPSLLPQGSRDFASGAGAATRRKIPEAIKRAVFRRSEGRCQHLLPDGSRCGATRMVEIDHIVPVARGGGDEAANLTLVCREHNQYRARLIMGDGTMDRFRSENRSSDLSRRMTGP